MKLDAKQMHIASQLFMAAGKAGQPFDLARFTKEPGYASETLAKLSSYAAAKKNETLQTFTALTQEMLSPLTSASTPAVASPPALPADTAVSAKKYIGGLR
jgi:hypothetical protein